VAVLGWTNVGKSTLVNRLVGEHVAAVAPAPQTTRHRIVGVRTIPGRGQIVFTDTPGLHRPRHRMNRAMVEQARGAPSHADLVLLVVDAARGIGAGDREAAGLLRPAGPPSVVVLNKIDRVRPRSALLPLMQAAQEAWTFEALFPVSAQTGEGCDALLEGILGLLPEGPPLYEPDYLTDQTERTLAAEFVREKLLRLTTQELPHATAVITERWMERGEDLVEIEATILVERESQKPIVIGKGGRLLKQVGSEARRDLERLLQRRVCLKLWVKTARDWRDDERVLRRLGLEA
jgi:GTP-binding protein Era